MLEAIPPLGSDDPLVVPDLDGKPFISEVMNADLLSKYPYWLREQMLVRTSKICVWIIDLSEAIKNSKYVLNGGASNREQR